MLIIGHGIDLVDLDRIASMIERHGDRFLERVFTDGERAYADGGGRRRVERYAARFAAKEAVFKAIGTGWRSGITWRDVDVRREPSGAPSVHLSGRCREVAEERGVERWRISLSHTDRTAIASVIAIGRMR